MAEELLHYNIHRVKDSNTIKLNECCQHGLNKLKPGKILLQTLSWCKISIAKNDLEGAMLILCWESGSHPPCLGCPINLHILTSFSMLWTWTCLSFAPQNEYGSRWIFVAQEVQRWALHLLGWVTGWQEADHYCPYGLQTCHYCIILSIEVLACKEVGESFTVYGPGSNIKAIRKKCCIIVTYYSSLHYFWVDGCLYWMNRKVSHHCGTVHYVI